ncbi:MAG: metal ABC transporter ATP-binding protein [Actinomycetia bacterium]|nr:metal ABC transporter ATP-binding protein [Actinomycetes bacterium]
MNEPAIKADRVTVAYGPVTALDSVDVSIPRGTVTAVIGPNGSGKSTFLRASARLVTPTRGKIHVPALDSPGGVALVLQSTDLEAGLPLSVGEAVRMARYQRLGLAGRFKAADRQLVEAAIDRLELGLLVNRQLSELSGGQRQRVLVAQGLAQESDLLLLDEPLTGLDIASRDRIWSIVADERAARRTVVVSTHDLDDARRCDLVMLVATKLVAFGTPKEVLDTEVLREAYGNRLVRVDGGSVLLDDPHHDHDH